MVKIVQLWVFPVCITSIGLFISAHADIDPVTGEVMRGDAAAQSFAEYCEGEIGPERKEKFNTSLDQANRAIKTGNQAGAETELQNALQATWRGGAYSDTGVRCLGEAATQRWFDTRLAMWRLGWDGAPEGHAAKYPEVVVIAADGGTAGLTGSIGALQADEFGAYYNAVENVAQRTRAQQQFGTLLLSEEVAIANACEDALPALQRHAAQAHADTLAAEEVAFNRPATEQELQAMNTLGGIQQFAGAMAGVSVDAEEQQQTLVANRQVQESRDLLNTARGWELDQHRSEERLPSDLRAEKRGDTLLARANSDDHSLPARDEFYAMALKYLNWCACDAKADRAEAARESIQPALEAYEAQQAAKMEAATAELEKKAEALRQSTEDMEKTEAERKIFNEEADALEAELGF